MVVPVPLSHFFPFRVSVTRNNILRKMCFSTSCSSQNSHTRVGETHSFTNGKDRLGHIMQMYEDVVGLTEVKTAQDKVVDAERNFLKVQEDRRNLQQELTGVQNEVRSVAAELEKMHRTDPCYVDLIKKEHGILVVEKEMTEKLKTLDKSERYLFSSLSACVRESHEKERARAERTKYWSIIGSVVGAVIGITGSLINNHRRLKEMRSMIQESGQNSAEYKDIADKIIASLTLLPQLQVQEVQNNGDTDLSGSFTSDMSMNIDKLQEKNDFNFKDLKTQTAEILSHISGMEKMVASLQSADVSGNVVYVGPEIESLLQEAESRFEKTANKHLVKSVCAVSGIVTIGVFLINFLFKGT